MASRLTVSARLVSRISAAAVAQRSSLLAFRLPVLAPSAVSSAPRSFLSTTRRLANDKPASTPSTSAALPTESEQDVRADEGETPLSPELAVKRPTESEADVVADEGRAPVVEEPAVSEEVSAEDAEKELQARTVFVGGLSWNVDNEWLQDEILKAIELDAGVESVRIARNPMGKSKGFAFIVFDTPEIAAKAAAVSPLEIDSRSVELRPSGDPPRPRAPRVSSEAYVPRTSARNPPTFTVWAGNLPWSVTDSHLEDIFSSYGAIKRIAIPTDQESGRSRGIAYIEFDGEGAGEVVREAYEGAGFEIDGRRLTIDYAAAPSRDRAPSGGGRGGGFGGRGGSFGGGRGGRRDDGGRGGGRSYGNRDGGEGRSSYGSRDGGEGRSSYGGGRGGGSGGYGGGRGAPRTNRWE